MKVLKILYLLLGLGLLVWVFQGVDLAELWHLVSRVGWGMAVVLGLYFVAFVIDSYTWQLTLLSVPRSLRWLYRTWKVRMVGEVFNSVMPAAGMGGEPVKAVLLKKYYGIGYREGTASLILAKTINMIALAIFLATEYHRRRGISSAAGGWRAASRKLSTTSRTWMGGWPNFTPVTSGGWCWPPRSPGSTGCLASPRSISP